MIGAILWRQNHPVHINEMLPGHLCKHHREILYLAFAMINNYKVEDMKTCRNASQTSQCSTITNLRDYHVRNCLSGFTPHANPARSDSIWDM